MRLCQDRASYTSGPGDSGSPVLAPDVDSPIQDASSIYGVHWGSGGIYSSIWYIHA